MARTLERRFLVSELQVNERKIEGYAAMFNKRSDDLGGFVEVVRSTAFNKTIREADVRALYNHDCNMVLGRSMSETLRLSIDDSGLYYSIDPPDTTYARDLMVSMERGDINQSSFAFFTMEDDWTITERDYPLRSLIEVSLVDVSPVTYPAYPDATSGVTGYNSAALASLSKRCGAIDLNDPAAVIAALKGIATTTKDAGREPTSDVDARKLALTRAAKLRLAEIAVE